MYVTINIKIEENQLKHAIAEGWNERTGENIDAGDIGNLENPEDYAWAMQFIDSECITSVQVKS